MSGDHTKRGFQYLAHGTRFLSWTGPESYFLDYFGIPGLWEEGVRVRIGHVAQYLKKLHEKDLGGCDGMLRGLTHWLGDRSTPGE